jgi:hypothetical protein
MPLVPYRLIVARRAIKLSQTPSTEKDRLIARLALAWKTEASDEETAMELAEDALSTLESMDGILDGFGKAAIYHLKIGLGKQ